MLLNLGDSRAVDQQPSRDARLRSVANAQGLDGLGELGVSLGIATTVEGVETNKQRELVRLQDCDQIQEYFYDHPIPNRDILKTLNVESSLAVTAP